MTNETSGAAVDPARNKLFHHLLYGWSASEVVAEQLLDARDAEVLTKAIEAARGEYLEDATGTPEDEAYNQAVSDVVAAIGALLEGAK
ncbi:hypothetical protein [Streptomyces mirabilis]|uniref:hypothetical protein n=1 Tax=Streptomyces mirabilis TaxID=68239 RepID=UPI0036C1803D